MRRRYISDEERENIVQLRKSGAGWLRIETMTGIPRRTAKRAFEETQQRQSKDEIQAARRQVVADLFQLHLIDLIAMAEAIVTSLSQPDLADKRDGNSILANVLATNIRNRRMTGQVVGAEQTDVIRRQNRILLDSLKQHTDSKIRWQKLDDWRMARNEWQNGMRQLRATSMTLIRNFMKQESNRWDPAISTKLDDRLIDRMVNGIVEAAYHALVDGRLYHVERYINTREHQGKMLILFRVNVSTTELILESKELAEKGVALCRQVVNSLAKGRELEKLEGVASSLQEMKAIRDMFAEELDELTITPLLVRTKCDICPA